jgi:hypothetical protein
MAYYLLLFASLSGVTTQVTDPSQLPGFSTLQGCVQGVFGGSGNDVEAAVGCDDWYFVCNHYNDAYDTLSLEAFTQCTALQYISEALSVLTVFCGQIPALETPSPLPVGITNPSPYPYFSTFRNCVQSVFGGAGYAIEAQVSCADWSCVCQAPNVEATAAQVASSQCTVQNPKILQRQRRFRYFLLSDIPDPFYSCSAVDPSPW